MMKWKPLEVAHLRSCFLLNNSLVAIFRAPNYVLIIAIMETWSSRPRGRNYHFTTKFALNPHPIHVYVHCNGAQLVIGCLPITKATANEAFT